MTEQKLKNCPFCGGKAIKAQSTKNKTKDTQYWILCGECEIRTLYEDDDWECASETWNTRADNAQRYKEALELIISGNEGGRACIFCCCQRSHLVACPAEIAKNALKNNP